MMGEIDETAQRAQLTLKETSGRIGAGQKLTPEFKSVTKSRDPKNKSLSICDDISFTPHSKFCSFEKIIAYE